MTGVDCEAAEGAVVSEFALGASLSVGAAAESEASLDFSTSGLEVQLRINKPAMLRRNIFFITMIFRQIKAKGVPKI